MERAVAKKEMLHCEGKHRPLPCGWCIPACARGLPGRGAPRTGVCLHHLAGR